MQKFKHCIVDLLSWGLLGVLFICLPILLSRQWHEPQGIDWWNWLQGNLGYSVFAFLLVLFVFALLVFKLKNKLASDHQQEDQVQQLDSMTDMLISLAFGVGVIWTAIGMRNALVNGLGNIGEHMADGGNAFVVLERLVDGGILVALSTTIVGGVLGYMMRLSKSVLLGRKLHQFYSELDNRVFDTLAEDVSEIKRVLLRKGV